MKVSHLLVGQKTRRITISGVQENAELIVLSYFPVKPFANVHMQKSKDLNFSKILMKNA